MFESRGGADLTQIVALLGGLAPSADPQQALARIRVLEEIKAAAAAAQITQTVAFAETREAADAKVEGRAVAAEIGLARRCSPHRASRELGWARILVRDLPATVRVLAAGRTTEWRSLLLARETSWLTAEQRAVVDGQLAARLERMGDRETQAEATRAAYRLDPHTALARARAATGDRRVTLRPAPDTMTRLTAILPVTQGVAVLAALIRAADSARATGEPRTRGQVMADTLVERVTGQAHAEQVPVTVDLIMTDHTLLGRSDEPAQLDGYGPIPAPLARAIATTRDPDTTRTVRRLFTDPAGRIVTMETQQRCFTPAMRHFVRLVDQHCQTPWCNAPIRQIDHKVPASRNGPTSLTNAQGLCENCNYTRQAHDKTLERNRAPDRR